MKIASKTPDPSRLYFPVLFLLLCVLFALRRPDSLLNPQFWAEDGNLLFFNQLVEGGLRPVFEPYRGYFIVNTRLVAAFAALFPIAYAPLIYNLAAIAIAACACSLFSLAWYRWLVRSDALRAAACVAAACALYTESLVDNLANSQWYLALAALVLLARRGPERAPAWLEALCALAGLLAALTNPVLAVAAPVCLWLLFVEKRNRAVAAAVLAGVAAQILDFVIAAATPDIPPAATTLGRIDHLVAAGVISVIYKVVLSTVAGWKAAAFTSESNAVGLFLCVLIGTVAWLAWLWLRLDNARRLQAGCALYLAAASILLPLASRAGLADAFITVTQIRQPRGEQYFFIAGCMFVFMAAFTIDAALRPWKGWAQACLMMALAAGGVFGNFRAPAFPDLHWREGAAQIEAWHAARARHVPAGAVRVPLNPAPVLTLQLPATFPELTITGIPGHLAAFAGSASGGFATRDAWTGRYPDGVYVALPPVFGVNVAYRVRAVVRLNRGDAAFLTAHGKMANESRAASAPAAADNDIQAVETRLVTDDSARLCFHIRGRSGTPPAVESVTITPF